MNKEYWKESLIEILGEYGVNIQDDRIDSFTDDVMLTAQLEGQYTGTENIPNPLSSEIERLEKKLKTLEEYYNSVLMGVKEGVAKRRGVSVNDVSIDDNGKVTYFP